jgi:Leu/Phe-tRNA-protein transferase
MSLETTATFVGAGAAVVSAISTIAIAYLVQRFSLRSARQQAVQTINSHFKSFSHTAFADQDFAEFLRRKYLPDRSLDFVRELYVFIIV